MFSFKSREDAVYFMHEASVKKCVVEIRGVKCKIHNAPGAYRVVPLDPSFKVKDIYFTDKESVDLLADQIIRSSATMWEFAVETDMVQDYRS